MDRTSPFTVKRRASYGALLTFNAVFLYNHANLQSRKGVKARNSELPESGLRRLRNNRD